MYCEFALKVKIENNLQLNHCWFRNYALSIKTRAMSAIHCLQRKVNCQLDHPFSAVTVYITKL